MNVEAIEKAKENLKDFIEEYKDNCFDHEIELKHIKDEFVRKFSITFIENDMTEDDYCIGHPGNTNNFCYLIERRLKGLGSILGATSSKFGLYWSKSKETYLPTIKFGANKKDAFQNIKNELIKIIKAAENNDMYSISTSRFSYMIRHKIYYLYNSNFDIPIFCENHLDKILDYYGISYVNDHFVESNKRKALYNFKSKDPDFSKLSNEEFMSFLYNEKSGLDLKDKKIIDSYRKGEEIEFIVLTNLEDINRQNSDERYNTNFNYNEIARRKTFVGDAGEDIVLKYEKSQHPQYKRKIKKVSKNPFLGYDILSFDDYGNEVHIEVKTKVNGSAENIDFYLTANELEKLSQNENHKIYYVCGIKNKTKKIYEINKDLFKKVTATPILYKIKARKANC